MATINLDKIDFDKLSVSEKELTEWVENNQDKIKEARELWLDLETRIISAVGNPAHNSDFVALKNAESQKQNKVKYSLTDKSEELQIAYAPAMVPDELDKEGDLVPEPVVRNTAHNFIKDKRVEEADMEHETPKQSSEAINKRGTIVESWILKEDQEYELVDGTTQTYQKGVWMVGIQYNDDVWNKIKSGEINGYSIHGSPTVVKNTTRYINKENNNTNMGDKQDNITVSVDQKEIAEQIASKVSETVEEQVDLEPETETKEVEVFPDFSEYTAEKEISEEQTIEFLAEQKDLTVDEITEAIESITKEEDEEEDEEEMEDEQKSVNRNASENSQIDLDEEDSEDVQKSEDFEEELADMWS